MSSLSSVSSVPAVSYQPPVAPVPKVDAAPTGAKDGDRDDMTVAPPPPSTPAPGTGKLLDIRA